MDFTRLSHVVPNLRTISTPDGPVVAPQKAYRNVQWLTGSSGKAVRILSEFIEPTERMAAAGVHNTILVFGSARARSPANYEAAQKRLAEAQAAPGLTPDAQAKLARQKLHLDRQAWMALQYDQIVELSRRLADWSLRRAQGTGAPLYCIATGGGPGIMEAANKGASLVPGAINVGMGISLPFEAGINPYVTPELSMEFHYFFMRKFVMCNSCRCFIAGAGGYGTFDELFEVLTLMQSGKIEFADLMPVVLFGVDFWKGVVNFDALLDRGVISEHDIDRLFFTDSVDDAFAHITAKLVQYEAAKAAKAAEDAEAARKNASAAAMAFNANLSRAREQAGSAFPDGLAVAGLPPGLSIHIARNPSLSTLQQAHAEDGGDAFLETDFGSGAGAMPVGRGSGAAGASSSSTFSGLEAISETTPTPTPGSFSPPGPVPAPAEKAKGPRLQREFSSE